MLLLKIAVFIVTLCQQSHIKSVAGHGCDANVLQFGNLANISVSRFATQNAPGLAAMTIVTTNVRALVVPEHGKRAGDPSYL